MKTTTAVANPTTPAATPAEAVQYTNAELLQIAADQAAQYKKSIVRSKIEQRAGDPLSMLGSTSDAAAMLLVSLAELLTAIASATTLAQVKAAASGNSIYAESAALLADIKAGAVEMPYSAKGGVGVAMQDIKHRASGVAAVLAGK